MIRLPMTRQARPTQPRHLLLSGALLLASLTSAGNTQAMRSLAPVSPRLPCTTDSFANISMAEAPAQVRTAEVVTRHGHPVCQIQGVISPQIRFLVQLPVTGWTQRYLQTGCGGLCGRLVIHAPQRVSLPEQQGALAMAATDMGHTDGTGGIWAAADPQLRVDFGYRAVHATRLIAGELMQRYYGQQPRYTYFSGCSDGGREGLMAAQRYPQDFNGIAAGAPSLLFTVQNTFYHGWNARIVQPDSNQPAIREEDLPILHRHALQTCDGADGTQDGLISNPACTVDPNQWVCPDHSPHTHTATRSCLSARAARAAAEIYRGAHDGHTRLVVGAALPGSELAWLRVLVPRSALLQHPVAPSPPSLHDTPIEQVALPPAIRTVSLKSSRDIIPNLILPGAYRPDWRLADLAFSRATLQQLRPMHALLDASDPDLSAYRHAGGKLLIWHGLADPNISPLNSIAYWQAVHARDAQADQLLRLFLIPGMYHCDQGEGLGSVDVSTPLMDWVEDGRAPDTLFASASASQAGSGQGRPIQRFPFLTILRPGGHPDRASDWQRGQPIALDPALYRHWAGADFFRSGFQQFCGFSGLTFTCHP